jgi:ABC-2 type transport system ATP-binding protein
MPLISTRALTKRYPGNVTALDALTVDIEPGVIGLVGANGAGKSTLLKILLGLLPATEGEAQVLELDTATNGARIRELVGYMPEHDCLPPDVSATEFVSHMARVSGLPAGAARERTADVLRHVGLYEERYRPIGGYSTGMKQRVKLAQALVHDPRVLFLDEPTNGLDPDGREEMLALIHDVSQRRQMSLILCSHLLRDVERVCESVIVFNQGEVAARGSIAELTGARRSVYDLRLKGEAAAFLTDLKDQGCEWRESEDGYRLFLADGVGPDVIFRTARDCGVQVRYLRPGATSLEDVFLRALGHETS